MNTYLCRHIFKGTNHFWRSLMKEEETAGWNYYLHYFYDKIKNKTKLFHAVDLTSTSTCAELISSQKKELGSVLHLHSQHSKHEQPLWLAKGNMMHGGTGGNYAQRW